MPARFPAWAKNPQTLGVTANTQLDLGAPDGNGERIDLNLAFGSVGLFQRGDHGWPLESDQVTTTAASSSWRGGLVLVWSDANHRNSFAAV